MYNTRFVCFWHLDNAELGEGSRTYALFCLLNINSLSCYTEIPQILEIILDYLELSTE